MTNRRRVGALLAMALLFAATLAWNLRADGSHSQPAQKSSATSSPTSSRAARPPLPSRAEFLRMLAATKPDARHAAADPHDHPHPITPDHERLYRDVDLLREADDAIKAGAYDKARALLAQHRRELGGMSAVEEEGLWLLADCAQHGRAEDVERVRSFYEEHTDSTVRRRLRRACLEPAETH